MGNGAAPQKIVAGAAARGRYPRQPMHLIVAISISWLRGKAMIILPAPITPRAIIKSDLTSRFGRVQTDPYQANEKPLSLQ